MGAQTLAAWDQPVNAAATDGTLTKNAGCNLCPDAGAHSAARLTTAGYAEFIPESGQRMSAGLTVEEFPAVSGTQVDYAFSIWPAGTFEIREKGLYRSEGAFAPGDKFRIAIEYGKIVYRRNGELIYTSKVLPTGALSLSATLMSSGASLHDAALYFSADFVTDPPPPPPPPPIVINDLPLGIVSAGPYQAIIERLPHAKPALPVLGPAGTWFTDPVFGSRILRVTDGLTRPGSPDRSFRSPSSPHQNAWSANGSYFYVVSGDGSVMPYAFNARKGTATRVQPTTTGSGGLVLSFFLEPQFSYINDTQIYGSMSASSRTVTQYDFATSLYTKLLDLDTVVPGLGTTFIGGIASSASTPERISAFFGGTSQDRHHYVVVFDKNNPGNRHVLDSLASTIDGVPTSRLLAFSLHHVAMDRSGRYVMLYTTYADQASARKAAQSYLWDTETNAIAELSTATLPYGHDAFGYGVSVNQDCCVSTRWDAAQWQFRNLASPLTTRELIKNVVSPKETNLSEHSTWNNAQPDQLVPYVSGLYRYGIATTEWRAWDDEIVAVQTNATNADATVWRFAHHRTDVHADNDPVAGSFWYQPRPNISHDGRWVMFTSNWEKTLGTDPTGDAATRSRQDVFVVELKSSTPPPADVTLDRAALDAGRVSVSYSAALRAAGGRGTYSWRLTSGALPGGLSFDATTGAISGVPTTVGTFTFDVQAWDPTEPLNLASARYAITIAPPPVTMAMQSWTSGRLTVAYAAAPVAAGGAGTYAWSITQGSLPSGVALDAATGAIAGTPTVMGTYPFTVTVADMNESANAASASATIAVGAAPVAIAPITFPAGRERVSYRAQLVASGGSGMVVWSVASGVMPAGLVLNSTTGLISGSPARAGTYPVTLAATDSGDAANVARINVEFVMAAGIKVDSPRLLPGAGVGMAYAYQVLAANAQGNVKWNMQGGSLPPGMSLSVTGLISGTCTVPGTWSFNVRVKDVNTDDTLTVTIVVK